MKITVLGAGTWGVALASLLFKNGHEVTLWSAIPAELSELRETGRHKNLPEAKIPEGISYDENIARAIEGSEMLLFVVASAYIRKTAALVAPLLCDGVMLVNASHPQNAELPMLVMVSGSEICARYLHS